ncbi:MAG: type IV pilus secretin PilQ family protein, partial [Ottowia sp.]|nr:type IV pilus secretin PilQ family protein [Ottowia sp.]
NGLGKNVVELGAGNAIRANVVQTQDRTRVVLNLKQATTYTAEVQGRSLLVALNPVARATPAANGGITQVFAEPRSVGVQSLRDIDFRRGPDSAGKVILELPNDQVGVDIQQRGQSLVVELLKTSLPEGLRRRLDVSDFGTPVQIINTVQNGNNVRVTIEPHGVWEHSAYQSDNQLVVEVRPQKVSRDKLTAGQGYNGEKLSLNFQDIDVRSLLQVIADFTNFNIVTSDTVRGNLTLRLKDVPWDQALDIILQAKNLGMKRSGNVLQIAPKDELAAKEKAELEALKAISDLEPLRTQAFQLNYAKAKNIRDQLKDSSGTGTSNHMLSARGSVIAEERTNQLFITDVPSRLAQIEEMIAKLDVPVRQVLIEARIVEATDTFNRDLGVRLGGHSSANRRLQVGTGNYSSNDTGTSFDFTNFLNLPAPVGNPATLAVTLFSKGASSLLNLEISALEGDSKGRIISSPRVVTADQTKATIKQGTQIAYQESAGQSGATSTSFKDAVLKLDVTPQITPEGNIILDLVVNKDKPVNVPGYAEPAIDTNEITTQVLVENGGTVVIGGIYTIEESEAVSKVPLLGDIPVVGNLFKQRSRSDAKRELLVFITPRMLAEQGHVR